VRDTRGRGGWGGLGGCYIVHEAEARYSSVSESFSAVRIETFTLNGPFTNFLSLLGVNQRLSLPAVHTLGSVVWSAFLSYVP
jgi:hypothetical protein